jgi:hypothetical protein
LIFLECFDTRTQIIKERESLYSDKLEVPLWRGGGGESVLPCSFDRFPSGSVPLDISPCSLVSTAYMFPNVPYMFCFVIVFPLQNGNAIFVFEPNHTSLLILFPSLIKALILVTLEAIVSEFT